MKKIRHFIFAAAVMALSPIMQSCLDDDDSTPYYSELGTVISNSENNKSQVKGDEYGISTITNRDILKSFKVDSVGQRMLYTFVEDKNNDKDRVDSEVSKQNIRIYDIYKVLTKKMNVLDKDTEEDIYGDDPIAITAKYVSEAHLNIRFQVRGSNSNIRHRISLVGTPDAAPNADGVLNLEFRHNDEGDSPYEIKWGFVSFTLESIPGYTEGTLKKIILSYNSFNEKQEKTEIDIEKKDETSFKIKDFPNTKTK